MSDKVYIDGTYSSSHPAWHDEDAPWKASQIYRILEDNNLKPHRIVDVGCGAGGVLASLVNSFPPSQPQAVGFDISPDAINMACRVRAAPGFSFRCGDFLETNDADFDLLLCIDVFEHVEDYLGFLRKLRPRAKLHVFHIPLDMYISGLLRKGHLGMRQEYGHIHYFDRFTAIETLKYTNYRIIDARYTHIAEDLLDVHPERKNLRRMIGNTGRRCLRSLLNEDWSNQLLGGSSLLVLTSQN
jgi:SAM-dependent methyltransferase